MRKITDHIVEGDIPQNQLRILVLDPPGAGGANHEYSVRATFPSRDALPEQFKNAQIWRTGDDGSVDIELAHVSFQNGPIKEAGLNGVTQEVLLAIVIDRLRCFQAGPFACRNNGDAWEHIAKGLDLLQARTRDRIARGVEGQTKA